MIGILDVSGAMEILWEKDKSKKFYRVLHEVSYLSAPDLYVPELTNTLWKIHKAKNLTNEECVSLIQEGIKLVDKFIDCKDIWQEAFSAGLITKHSVYDMFYMVAARRSGGILITSDSVLAAVCKKNNVEVCF